MKTVNGDHRCNRCPLKVWRLPASTGHRKRRILFIRHTSGASYSRIVLLYFISQLGLLLAALLAAWWYLEQLQLLAGNILLLMLLCLACVALVRALWRRSAYIFVDEPTASLDEANRKIVIGLLRQAVARGACVVVSTHDAALVDMCDQKIRLGAAESDG